MKSRRAKNEVEGIGQKRELLYAVDWTLGGSFGGYWADLPWAPQVRVSFSRATFMIQRMVGNQVFCWEDFRFRMAEVQFPPDLLVPGPWAGRSLLSSL